MKIEEIQKAFEDFFKNYSPEEPHSTYQDEEGKTQKIYKKCVLCEEPRFKTDGTLRRKKNESNQEIEDTFFCDMCIQAIKSAIFELKNVEDTKIAKTVLEKHYGEGNINTELATLLNQKLDQRKLKIPIEKLGKFK